MTLAVAGSLTPHKPINVCTCLAVFIAGATKWMGLNVFQLIFQMIFLQVSLGEHALVIKTNVLTMVGTSLLYLFN